MSIILTFFLYVAITGTTTALVSKGVKTDKKGFRLIILLFTAIILSIMAAYRGGTGTDSLMYQKAYTYGIGSVFRYSEFEIGFRILIDILKGFGFTYHALFFVMSFTGTCFVFATILHFEDCIDVKLAAFVYVLNLYFYSYNAMRQGMAICICLYAMTAFVEGKNLKSLVCILLAGMFHTSAFICIAIIAARFLYQRRYSKVFIVATIAVALFLVFNRYLLGDIVYRLTSSLYYASYFKRDAYADGSTVRYYIKALPLLFVSLKSYRNYESKSEMRVFFVLMICGIILGSLETMTATQVGRVGAYFDNLEILLIPFCARYSLPLIGKIKLSRRNLIQILYLYYFLLAAYSMFYRGFSDMVPYLGLFKG